MIFYHSLIYKLLFKYLKIDSIIDLFYAIICKSFIILENTLIIKFKWLLNSGITKWIFFELKNYKTFYSFKPHGHPFLKLSSKLWYLI